MQSALNSPLIAVGIEQAQAQGRIMAQVDLSGFDVLVSPQGRAFQTAGIALAPLVARLTTLEDLHEITVGDWAGMLRADLPALPDMEETPDGALALYEHAPGGEGYARLKERCLRVLNGLSGPSVLVTHGITSRMLRTLHLGRDIEAMGDLPGGRGIVFHLKDGAHRTLTDNLHSRS